MALTVFGPEEIGFNLTGNGGKELDGLSNIWCNVVMERRSLKCNGSGGFEWSSVRGTPLHLKIREGRSKDFASFVAFLIGFEYEIPHNNEVCRLLLFLKHTILVHKYTLILIL